LRHTSTIVREPLAQYTTPIGTSGIAYHVVLRRYNMRAAIIVCVIVICLPQIQKSSMPASKSLELITTSVQMSLQLRASLFKFSVLLRGCWGVPRTSFHKCRGSWDVHRTFSSSPARSLIRGCWDVHWTFRSCLVVRGRWDVHRTSRSSLVVRGCWDVHRTFSSPARSLIRSR
jgi:hypothetical protein